MVDANALIKKTSEDAYTEWLKIAQNLLSSLDQGFEKINDDSNSITKIKDQISKLKNLKQTDKQS